MTRRSEDTGLLGLWQEGCEGGGERLRRLVRLVDVIRPRGFESSIVISSFHSEVLIKYFSASVIRNCPMASKYCIAAIPVT